MSIAFRAPLFPAFSHGFTEDDIKQLSDVVDDDHDRRSKKRSNDETEGDDRREGRGSNRMSPDEADRAKKPRLSPPSDNAVRSSRDDRHDSGRDHRHATRHSPSREAYYRRDARQPGAYQHYPAHHDRRYEYPPAPQRDYGMYDSYNNSYQMPRYNYGW
eukprot:Colp12_sorted_trinity150504_noHs@7883